MLSYIIGNLKKPIVTADGNPVTAGNNFPVVPKRAMHEIDAADLVIVPSQGFFFDPSTNDHQQRIEWLRDIHARGSDLASVCAGAFTLASTGLLNGKTATTHWSLAKQFRKQFVKDGSNVFNQEDETSGLYRI